MPLSQISQVLKKIAKMATESCPRVSTILQWAHGWAKTQKTELISPVEISIQNVGYYYYYASQWGSKGSWEQRGMFHMWGFWESEFQLSCHLKAGLYKLIYSNIRAVVIPNSGKDACIGPPLCTAVAGPVLNRTLSLTKNPWSTLSSKEGSSEASGTG